METEREITGTGRFFGQSEMIMIIGAKGESV